MKEGAIKWTANNAAKSIVLFVVHFIVLVLISLFLLLKDKLNVLADEMNEHGADYLYMVFCLLMLTILMYAYFFFESKETLASAKTVSLVFTLLDLYIIVAFLLGTQGSGGADDVAHAIFSRPVALTALLTLVLIGRKEAIFLNIVSGVIMFLLDIVGNRMMITQTAYSSLIVVFVAGMFAIFLAGKANTRIQIIGVGVLIVIPIILIIFLLELTTMIDGSIQNEMFWPELFGKMGYGLMGGVLSAVLFLFLLPIFEGLFNRLTVYRLRELTAPDAPLLKRLKQQAPGTFNHSETVAQLAEACAEALGENVDYARAAAYYHDVGKAEQPEYFTENQQGYNPHDELTPELSTDIIRLHAQTGSSMIRSSRLPTFLADVALEHHGTLPIRYFYAKALKMTDGELNIEDFSYTGPKPRTKIAAIIMIADGSEAAARSLPKRTPEAVEKVVRGVIEERMQLEQFADCDITLKELTIIRKTLVETLTGVYHHRVKYPSIRYAKHEDGSAKGEV
jgi:putative nucleotidyltransferase with HDIG domain